MVTRKPPSLKEVRLYAELLQRSRMISSVRLIAPPDWGSWCDALYGYQEAGYAPHHRHFWEWVWTIEADNEPPAFVGIWPRGGAKSTSAERAIVALGARNKRRYCLYVCATQEQADKHVESIAAILEGPRIARHYPDMGQRNVGKYGSSRGWRRSRLRTASGFTIDALGLDTAARGIRVDEYRPDIMVFDDIDEDGDSKDVTDKKERIITERLLPAGVNTGLAVIFIQNLIHEDSLAARLANSSASYLSDRIVSGPIPALEGFSYEEGQWADGRRRYLITSGSPTWGGQDAATCQRFIDRYGPTAFLNESQHDIQTPEGGLFSHVSFQYIAPDNVPDLLAIEVWVDPAVTSKDSSDNHGIIVGGVTDTGDLYILYSWEGVTTPSDSLTRAMRLGIKVKARAVGVETDQGGDTWEDLYYRIAEEWTTRRGEANRPPPFTSAKAGAGHGSKVHRASLLLEAYERGRVFHVLDPDASYVGLGQALKRFPLKKPYDLVDAHYWVWDSLTNGPGMPSFW